MNKITAEEYKQVEDGNRKGLHGIDADDSSCIDIVGVLNLYGELGAEARESLAHIKHKPVELRRNQKVFSLCEGRADIFVVKEGWLSLSQATSTRGQDICNVFMPGDIIGMRESFFESHDIVIVSLTHCKLEKVSVDDLHDLFKHHEEIRKAITSYVMVNDNITIERLRSCTHHRSEERVAHFLLEVYARFDFKGLLTSNVFSFPVTQDVVGELLGMTSVHVSRCMTALEQKQLIRKTRNSVKLLKPEEMVRNTGFVRDFIYEHLCLG